MDKAIAGDDAAVSSAKISLNGSSNSIGITMNVRSENTGNPCLPPLMIVKYFVKRLSFAQMRNVDDHISGCRRCNVRLSALRIATELNAETLYGHGLSTIASDNHNNLPADESAKFHCAIGFKRKGHTQVVEQ
jgi:hypothetical protein